MKILSYNIESGAFKSYKSKAKKPEKFELLIQAIKKVGAEVVSLVDTFRWEEVFTNEELEKLFGYKKTHIFPVEIEDRKNHYFKSGITILTNLEINELENTLLKKRNALKIKIRENNKEMEMVSVHLYYRREDLRQEQIRAILERIDNTKPTIIVGDFNSIVPEELNWFVKIGVETAGKTLGLKKELEAFESMKEGKVVEMIKKAGFKDADGTGKRKTIPSRSNIRGIFGPFLRLDYLFFNRFIKINKFEVLKGDPWDKLSDHYPILIDLDIL